MSDRKLVGFDLNAVASFLRRQHPQKTAEHVAERIDAPAETVRQWLRGAAKPSFAATLALVGAYGPEFLAVALPQAPGWLARALDAERRREAMEDLRRAHARWGELNDAQESEGRGAARLGGALGAGLSGRRSAADTGGRGLVGGE